ncbi:MAG TPA: ATP-binding protein, partial [Candidatus Saccharimonadales bacterium]|nr:ATP-binding protein [Candidatus Saccharimonadales bacterium]
RESASRLRLNLLYFNLFILLLSAGLSYWLARRTLQPIEEMIEAQNRFTADASHELRTPITAMRTEVEVSLRDEKLDLKSAKELLGSNLEEIGKLEALSNSLLKLARYDGQNHLELTDISAREIIMAAFKKVEPQARHKNIDFDFNLADLTISVDKSRFQELLTILMENAVKYSPADTKVTIGTKKTDHHISITVADQGVGIKASDLPHVFDRFYRADQSRSKSAGWRKPDGYGLGLSIAKQIVESHHGKISAESKIGHGTTFVITLPI